MKRLLISILAVAALAAAPAIAADKDQHHPGQGEHGQTAHGDGQGGHHGNGQGGDKGGNQGGNQNYGRGNGRGNDNPSINHTFIPAVRTHTTTTVRHVDQPVFHRQPPHGTFVQPVTRRPQNWNIRPRTFDVQVYRRTYNAPHHYHWNNYNRPNGWYAHRWTYGERMPPAFWVRDYWVNDWWSFGLTIPPYGYEWVRYGDDAVLINVNTGEVLQVVYDLYD